MFGMVISMVTKEGRSFLYKFTACDAVLAFTDYRVSITYQYVFKVILIKAVSSTISTVFSIPYSPPHV